MTRAATKWLVQYFGHICSAKKISIKSNSTIIQNMVRLTSGISRQTVFAISEDKIRNENSENNKHTCSEPQMTQEPMSNHQRMTPNQDP